MFRSGVSLIPVVLLLGAFLPPAYGRDNPDTTGGSEYLKWAQARQARRAKVLAPPPPGGRSMISLTLSYMYVSWRGDVGHGSGAPDFGEVYEDGYGFRLRAGFTVFPTLDFGLSFGYERQEGREVQIPGFTTWSVRFQGRHMQHLLLESRFLLPLHLFKYKWFSPEWAGRQEGLIPYVVPFRLGILWHTDVDAWINDPNPPPVVDQRTPYFDDGLLATYELAFGLEYRGIKFSFFAEIGYRWASPPRPDENSLLTNHADPMQTFHFSTGGGIRF
jgi:hypothetical protein